MSKPLVSQPLALSLVMLLPALASADEPAAGPPTPTAVLHEMRFLDTNGDRQIDPEEFAGGQARAALLLTLSWDECDRDGDGRVTAGELESAAAEAALELSGADETADEEAAQELAQALSLHVLLDRLGQKEDLAAELEALKEAVEDWDDEEVVFTHIIHNPKLYPRLYPIITTYARRYPVLPSLRHRLGLKPYHPPGHYWTKYKPHKPKLGKPAVKPGKNHHKPPKAAKTRATGKPGPGKSMSAPKGGRRGGGPRP